MFRSDLIYFHLHSVLASVDQTCFKSAGVMFDFQSEMNLQSFTTGTQHEEGLDQFGFETIEKLE